MLWHFSFSYFCLLHSACLTIINVIITNFFIFIMSNLWYMWYMVYAIHTHLSILKTHWNALATVLVWNTQTIFFIFFSWQLYSTKFMLCATYLALAHFTDKNMRSVKTQVFKQKKKDFEYTIFLPIPLLDFDCILFIQMFEIYHLYIRIIYCMPSYGHGPMLYCLVN